MITTFYTAFAIVLYLCIIMSSNHKDTVIMFFYLRTSCEARFATLQELWADICPWVPGKSFWSEGCVSQTTLIIYRPENMLSDQCLQWERFPFWYENSKLTYSESFVLSGMLTPPNLPECCFLHVKNYFFAHFFCLTNFMLSSYNKVLFPCYYQNCI